MRTILFIILLAASCTSAIASIDTNRLANAIYLAEGGAKARSPYGICSVKVSGTVQARSVCLRTIKHALDDYRGGEAGFIDFLADRYCPTKVDPVGNVNWKKNVKFLYAKKNLKKD